MCMLMYVLYNIYTVWDFPYSQQQTHCLQQLLVLFLALTMCWRTPETVQMQLQRKSHVSCGRVQTLHVRLRFVLNCALHHLRLVNSLDAIARGALGEACNGSPWTQRMDDIILWAAAVARGDVPVEGFEIPLTDARARLSTNLFDMSCNSSVVISSLINKKALFGGRVEGEADRQVVSPILSVTVGNCSINGTQEAIEITFTVPEVSLHIMPSNWCCNGQDPYTMYYYTLLAIHYYTLLVIHYYTLLAIHYTAPFIKYMYCIYLIQYSIVSNSLSARGIDEDSQMHVSWYLSFFLCLLCRLQNSAPRIATTGRQVQTVSS